MRVVADTGPLLAALDRSERTHDYAVRALADAQESILIPDPVLSEVDHLARARLGPGAARLFLASIARDELRRVPSDDGVFQRALAYDTHFADLNLGIADATVMALAERERAQILTFDFAHFRATRPLRGGFWRLVFDERVLG